MFRPKVPQVKHEQNSEAAWETKCLDLEARLRPAKKHTPQALKYFLENDFDTYRIDDRLSRAEKLQTLHQKLETALSLNEEIRRKREAEQSQGSSAPKRGFGCCGSAQ